MGFKPAQLAGLALDIVGVGLIAMSLPDGGPMLWAGLAIAAIGSWLVAKGNPDPIPAADPDANQRKDGWLAEAELRQALPRAAQMTPLARVVIVSWTLMALVGGWFVYDRVWSKSPAPPFYKIVANGGVTATASIHRKDVREEASGGRTYYLYYNFVDEAGAGLRASTVVTKRAFGRYREGDSVEVAYLPGDPMSHYIPELTRSPDTLRGLLMVGVIVLFFGWILESTRRRHRRLVRLGRALPGNVENIRRRGAREAYSVRVPVDGREMLLRGNERSRGMAEGDRVTVLVDPAKPTDAVIYRTALYQALR